MVRYTNATTDPTKKRIHMIVIGLSVTKKHDGNATITVINEAQLGITKVCLSFGVSDSVKKYILRNMNPEIRITNPITAHSVTKNV